MRDDIRERYCDLCNERDYLRKELAYLESKYKRVSREIEDIECGLHREPPKPIPVQPPNSVQYILGEDDEKNPFSK